MRVDWRFLRISLIAFAGIGAMATYLLWRYGTASMIRGTIDGGIMSVCNFLLGYLAIEYGFERSNSVFLKVVLGSMLVRLLLMWSVFLVLIKVYEVHQPSLVVSLMAFYVVTLVLEISYLQKKVTVKSRR
ncbi:MAG TPA: hypothetical protein VMM57_07290 [Bacteroidota bacterium]|nr:hypothetical protein [Bacteroidota bacterium]